LLNNYRFLESLKLNELELKSQCIDVLIRYTFHYNCHTS